MTTTKKLVVAVVALSLALVTVVGGTLAWLVSTTEEVKNTFTVGGIEITLDEAKVDVYGAVDGATRVTKNVYKLVPNGSYIKDPTVHVAANNEKCYVFVKVDNGIEEFEAEGETTIAKQIEKNDWTSLSGVTNVFYKVVEASNSETDLIVFSSFVISEEVDKEKLATIVTDGEEGTVTAVTVQAYAIQYLGFEGKPVDAWNTVSVNP